MSANTYKDFIKPFTGEGDVAAAVILFTLKDLLCLLYVLILFLYFKVTSFG